MVPIEEYGDRPVTDLDDIGSSAMEDSVTCVSRSRDVID